MNFSHTVPKLSSDMAAEAKRVQVPYSVAAESASALCSGLWPALFDSENQATNCVFSPFSIANALAIVELGAREQTLQEIRKLLQVSGQQSPALHADLSQLQAALAATRQVRMILDVA